MNWHQKEIDGFAAIEKEIAKLVAQLYGLTEKEERECVESLRIPKGKPEELEEEEEGTA